MISNLSLNLAVQVRDPATGEERIARVKVPPVLPRFLPVGDDGAVRARSNRSSRRISTRCSRA